VISLTDFFDAASRRHNGVILLPAIRRVSGNDFVFQQDSAPAHRAALIQQLNCCVQRLYRPWLRQERPSFLAPNLWPRNSPDLSPVDYEIWAVMQHCVYYHRQKFIVWMNWNGGSSIRCLLWSWTVDFWRCCWPVARKTSSMSVLKEGVSSTARELTMLILSISVTFSVTCLTVTSLITKFASNVGQYILVHFTR